MQLWMAQLDERPIGQSGCSTQVGSDCKLPAAAVAALPALTWACRLLMLCWSDGSSEGGTQGRAAQACICEDHCMRQPL